MGRLTQTSIASGGERRIALHQLVFIGYIQTQGKPCEMAAKAAGQVQCAEVSRGTYISNVSRGTLN